MELPVRQSTGVVIRKSAAGLTPAQLATLADAPEGVKVTRTDFKVGDKTYTRVGFDGPEAATAKATKKYAGRFGPDVQIDFCIDKQPGPPLGMTPVSFSALNSELPEATLGIARSAVAARRRARDDPAGSLLLLRACVLLAAAGAGAAAELRWRRRRTIISSARDRGARPIPINGRCSASASTPRRNRRGGWSSTNAQPVIVAIIDTGLDWNHQNIDSDKLWRNPKEIAGQRRSTTTRTAMSTTSSAGISSRATPSRGIMTATARWSPASSPATGTTRPAWPGSIRSRG